MSGRALSDDIRAAELSERHLNFAEVAYWANQWRLLAKRGAAEVAALESRLALVERQLEEALAEPTSMECNIAEMLKSRQDAISCFIAARRERIVGGGE